MFGATLKGVRPTPELCSFALIGWNPIDGSGCRNAKLVAGSSERVDLTRRQAAERSVSVSVILSQVSSDHWGHGSIRRRDRRAHAKKTRRQDFKGTALGCGAQERRTVEDAARSLRGRGARITHSALFRAQLAETVLRLLDREIRVCGLSITPDSSASCLCTTLDDILNDTDGLQSPRKEFYPRVEEVLLTKLLYLDFPPPPVFIMGPETKSCCGTLDIGLEYWNFRQTWLHSLCSFPGDVLLCSP